MIVYGSKAVHLTSEQSQTAICPSCNTQGSLIFSVFRKHAHLFWIPLFPFGKNGVSECQHCKNVLDAKEMPEPIKRDFESLKDETKGPLWQFSGLILIALLMIWGNYSNTENKKLNLTYLASPKKGDVYEYKIEKRSYSTLKVIGITKDSVFITQNEYEISRKSKLYKIDKPENYSDWSYGISMNDLKEMYDSGEIFDINR